MKILITGATGYLGRYLVESLNSHELFLVTRSMSKAKKQTASTLQKILWIESPLDRNSLPAQKLDFIFHLASPNMDACEKNPEMAFEKNVNGTKHLVQLANQYEASQFVYFSTAHIYGKNLTGHVTEQTAPQPVSVYAKTHLEAEKIVNNEFKGQAIALRLSNIIGAPKNSHEDSWKLIVNELCRSAVVDKKITLKSSGLQKRNFCDVQELMRICLAILEDQIPAGVYNFGGFQQDISILDLAKKIQNLAIQKLRTPIILSKKDPAPLEKSVDLIYDSTFLRNKVTILPLGIEKAILETLEACLVLHS